MTTLNRTILMLMLAASMRCAMAAPSPVLPFTWALPDGFRHETLSFPLDFAPQIHHVGVEELRFTPGFQDSNAPDFFTYAFIWFISDDKLGAGTLQRDLTAYFDGLLRAVAAEAHESAPPVKTRVQVENGRPGETAFSQGPSFTAHVTTWDALFTKKPLNLTIRVYYLGSNMSGGRLYYFEVSPRIDDPKCLSDFNLIRPAIER